MVGRRGGGDVPCCEPKFWLFIAIIFGLVSFAGLMAGLTLGLMSLGLVDLEVLIKSGRPPDRIHAAKIFPVVKNQHLLLCTLLIGNSLAMESLPIFLDKLVSPWAAILISVTLILMFGEILPQAICSRYGMTVGATLAPFVRLLLLLFFPIAYPISKMLDWLLGKGHSALLRRAELKTFVDFHGNAAGKGGDLTHDETTIIAGALELTEKTAKDAMTLISNTFSLDLDGTLDVWTLDSIMTKGHSRVPVYTGSPNNIIGLILVKNLLTIDPKDCVPLRKMVIRKIPRVSENMPLYDILNEFQKGQSHIAVVVKDSNERKESLKKPKEVKQLEPKLNIEKKRAMPNVTLQKTVPDVSLCPALGEQDGLRGPTNSGQITGITESGLNDSQAATMQHKDSDQQSPIKAPVPGISVLKRRQRRSECILDVENTPLPTFSPNEEVVGVITMEDVIEELLQEEILDETDEYINIHNRIKVNMQASQRSNLQSKPSQPPSQPSSTLSSARTPTSTSPVSMTCILSEHSPASSYLIAPGPTPALSVSTSTSMTGSPVTFYYKASDGVSQRDS